MTASTELSLEGQPTHELLAQALRKRIALGGLPAGGRLPTERELALGLGVSRNTVRAAVRTLSGEGLIRTVRGRGGGSFVQTSSEGTRRRGRIASSWRQSIEDSYDFRLTLEPLAARWAATRGRASEQAALMGLLAEQPGDLAAYHQLDSHVHLLIARMARFDLLEHTIAQARQEMFCELNTLWMSFGTRPEEDAGTEHRQYFEGFRREHLPIAQAIQERWPQDAAAAMEAHLREARGQFTGILEQTADRAGPEGRKR